MGGCSVYTASPHLNFQHLNGGSASTAFQDNMADDMWALAVTFHDMIASSLQGSNTAFAACLPTTQAVQADRPNDSLRVQCRAAVYTEQTKWVSFPVQKL